MTVSRAPVLFLVGLALSSWACGEETPDDVEVGCRLNSDCAPGQSCDEGQCVVSEACVGPQCPCTDDEDCPNGLLCQVDTGVCLVPECGQDADCDLGELCLEGVCETDVEADRDRDGVPDTEDLCPRDQDADQEDNDLDGQGDACDEDDDNDAIPDSIDNCPFVGNIVQGDADGDRVGNACDGDTPGIDVVGVLDFSALQGADTDRARVFVSGRQEPVGINSEGEFVFDDALGEPGRFLLRVEWPGFSSVVQEFVAGDGQAVFEIPEALRMVPVSVGEDAIVARGRVQLGGAEDHGEVIVRARVGGALVTTTLSDASGAFALSLGPVDHALSLVKAGYEPLDVTLVYNTQGPLAGRFTVDSVPLEEAALVLEARPVALVSGQVASSLGALSDWPSRAFVTLISQSDATRRLAPVVDADQGRGQFQIAGVIPGLYTLAVSAQGHRPFSQTVDLADGDNPLDEVIVLEFEADDGELAVQMRGRVLLEAAQDHSDIVVRAHVGGNLVATTFTDTRGDFILDAGRVDHTLSLSRPGFVSQRDIEVRWDEADLRFEIDGQPLEDFEGLSLERLTGQIEVSVTIEPDWVPQGQRGVTVRVIGEAQERSAFIDDNGPAVLTDLPAGNYIVFTERPGFSLSQQVVTLDERQPNPRLDLSVRLVDLAAASLDLSGQTLTGDELRLVDVLTDANLAGVTLVGAEPDTGAELCNLNLSGVSFVGADLTGANLAGTSLVGARLDNTTLSGVDARSADLTSASLFGANLSDADLRNGTHLCRGETFTGRRTRLTGANLSSANLRGARFVDGEGPTEGDPCVLSETASPEFSSVRWNQADLSEAVMHSAALAQASFTSTIMADTDLRGACLAGATILRADMTDAKLAGADLSDASVLDALLLRADLQAARAEGIILSGVNLTDAVLDDLNAPGLSIAGAILGGASLVNANLEGSDWVGVLLSNVDLSGAVMDEADMRNTQFVDVFLTGVSFTNTDLRNSALVQLDARGADFSGADLTGADLAGADLAGASFVGTTLLGVNFRLARYDTQTTWPDNFEFRTIEAMGPEAQLAGFLFPNGLDASGVVLTNAVLTGARMIGIDLTGADLRGVSLANADLTGASLVGADLGGADMTSTAVRNMRAYDLLGCPGVSPSGLSCLPLGRDARFALLGPNADLSDADLAGANLRNFILSDTILRNVDLTGADLSRADLSGADLSGADLTGANLEGTLLGGADLTGAILTGARAVDLSACPLALPAEWVCKFRFSRAALLGPGADLTRVNLFGTDLSGLNLRGANLTDAIFKGADLTGTDLGETIAEGLWAVDLTGCPATPPEQWSCVSQPAVGRQALVGPGAVLEGTDLSDIDLSGLNLQGVSMPSVDLVNANLSGADLSDALIFLANLNGANLAGANLTRTDLADADLRNADLSDTLMVETILRGADLTTLDMSGLTFVRIEASNLYRGCPLALPEAWVCVGVPSQGVSVLAGPGVNLNGAVLRGADLSGLDMSGANLLTVELLSANLTGTDLTGANMNQVDLRNANLTDANLTDAQLAPILFEGVIFSDGTICPDGRLQSELPGCGLE